VWLVGDVPAARGQRRGVGFEMVRVGLTVATSKSRSWSSGVQSATTERGMAMFANLPIHPVLAASDIDRAKKWYSEKLGLKPVSAELFGGLQYEAGGVGFLVYQSDFAGTNKATAVGFNVDNFDEVVDFLRTRGVEFEHVDFGEMGASVDGVIASPDGQKAAWFKDSEGNIFAVSTDG